MNEIKCLDYGFVKLLNVSSAIPRDIGYNARDTDPATCARISFDNFDEERTEGQDLKLVEYLIKNRHNTPIEMTEIWLEMKLPVFVARQFMRHRTFTFNEVSARYVQLPEEWYIPEIVGGKSTTGAKQGQENNLSSLRQEKFKLMLDSVCKESYNLYNFYISEGVAPEHARMFLHMNHYTHYICKVDLHNMLHFLSLRLHSHAQVEARIYAQAIYDLLEQVLPRTMELFNTYRKEQ